MEKKAYKYRLKELIGTVPRSASIGDIMRVMEAEYGISKASFYKHQAISIESHYVITESDLAKYAAFFGVTEAEVRNYAPVEKKKARTVFEILRTRQRPSLDSIASLANMVAPSA